MRNLSKVLAVVGVAAAVIILGLAVGWWGSSGPGRVESPDGATTGGTGSTNPATPVPPPRPGPQSVATATNQTPSTDPGTQVVTPVRPANFMTNWEDKLDEILASEGDDTNKVKELFEMFPRLDEEGQVEVAQHLSNLVSDEDYPRLAQLLKDPLMPEDVQDVLMADILNRPNSLKLPLLLDIAQTAEHAKASEARDLLELYLDEDHGTDWPKWRKHMETWLKDNPD